MFSDRTRFLGQVPLKTLGKVYSGEVSWVGDNICKIADAWVTGSPHPRETQIYYEEFSRWYGKVANIDWKEAELTEYIRQFCPKAVPAFMQMRAHWTSDRNTRRRRPQPTPPPLPPAGPPVASVDPYNAFRRMTRSPQVGPPPAPPYIPTGPNVPSVDRAAWNRPRRPYTPPLTMTPTVQPTSMLTPSSFSPTPTQSSYQQPFSPTPTQSSYQQSSIQQECPQGQFPAYPGGPCRGAVATGGLPSLPGGFSTADVSQGTFSTPSTSYGMYGARRPIPVMNVRRRG